MKRFLFAVSVLALLATGCSKDDDKDNTTPAANYQPLTTGSSWTYQTTSLSGGGTTSFVITATSKDSTVNGRAFKVFTNTAGGNEYYLKDGNSYFQYAGFAGLNTLVELTYLKGSEAKGATWSENKNLTLSGLPIPVVFNYTLEDKLTAYTVAGKAYSDVIHVKVVLAVTGLTITEQDLHFYYAAGIGRIQSKIKLTVPSFISANTETNLTASTIVP